MRGTYSKIESKYFRALRVLMLVIIGFFLDNNA